jgi:hypothetical protein
MNAIIRIRNLKKLLLVISFPPIIWLGVTYIVYGALFNQFFTEGSSLTSILNLPNLNKFYNSITDFPIVVKLLGQFSISLIIFCYIIWFFSFTFSSYIELSHNTSNKINLLLELIIISVIYFSVISPNNIFLFLIGCIFIFAVFVLIIIYWIYEVRTKR